MMYRGRLRHACALLCIPPTPDPPQFAFYMKYKSRLTPLSLYKCADPENFLRGVGGPTSDKSG